MPLTKVKHQHLIAANKRRKEEAEKCRKAAADSSSSDSEDSIGADCPQEAPRPTPWSQEGRQQFELKWAAWATANPDASVKGLRFFMQADVVRNCPCDRCTANEEAQYGYLVDAKIIY